MYWIDCLFMQKKINNLSLHINTRNVIGLLLACYGLLEDNGPDRTRSMSPDQ